MSSVLPITTLNNADGFSKRETSVLNRALLAEMNRWIRKSIQPVAEPLFEDILVSASGLVSASQTQSYNNTVTLHFYLNSSLLKKGVEIELLELKRNILSFYVDGNIYSPFEEDGDISNYLVFRAEKNKMYVDTIKSFEWETHIFNITLVMEFADD